MSITRLSLSVSQNSTPRRALPKRLPVSQLLLSQALKDAILAPTPSNPTNATPPRLSLDIALVDQVRRKWLPQKAAPSSAGLNTVNSPLYIRLEGGQRFPSARDLLALPVEVRSTVLQLAIGVLMFRLVPIVAVHLRRKAKSRLLRFLLSSRFNSRPSSSFLSPLPVFSNCQGLEELCEQGFEPRVFTYEEVIVFKGEPAESGLFVMTYGSASDHFFPCSYEGGCQQGDSLRSYVGPCVLGAVTLLSDHPQPQSIVCTSMEALVWVLPQATYKDFISRQHMMVQDASQQQLHFLRVQRMRYAYPMHSATLAKFSLLQMLPPEALDQAAKKLLPEVLFPGDCAYRQGDAAFSLFILVHGRVRLASTNAKGVSKKDVFVSAPAALGDISWITLGKRRHTLTCVTACDFYILTKDSMRSVIAKCDLDEMQRLQAAGQKQQKTRNSRQTVTFSPQPEGAEPERPKKENDEEEEGSSSDSEVNSNGASQQTPSANPLPLPSSHRRSEEPGAPPTRRQAQLDTSLAYMRYVHFVRMIPLLTRFLPDDDHAPLIKALAESFEVIVYPPRSTITSVADECNRLIIAMTGKAIITTHNRQQLQLNECIGFTLLEPHRWTHRVVAADSVECMEISLEVYERVLRQFKIYHKVLQLTRALLFPEATPKCDVEDARFLCRSLKNVVFYPTSGDVERKPFECRYPTEHVLQKLPPIKLKAPISTCVFEGESMSRIVRGPNHAMDPSAMSKVLPMILGKHDAPCLTFQGKQKDKAAMRKPKSFGYSLSGPFRQPSTTSTMKESEELGQVMASGPKKLSCLLSSRLHILHGRKSIAQNAHPS